MKTHRILTFLFVLTLIPAATFADVCSSYISCSDGGGPCYGELESGFRYDFSEVEFGGGIFGFYTGVDVCWEGCSYNMVDGDGEYTMTTYDWGCDGDAQSFTVR